MIQKSATQVKLLRDVPDRGYDSQLTGHKRFAGNVSVKIPQGSFRGLVESQWIRAIFAPHEGAADKVLVPHCTFE